MKFFQSDKEKPPVRKVLEIKVPENTCKIKKKKNKVKRAKKA